MPRAVTGALPVAERTATSDAAQNRPVRMEPGKVRLGFIPEEWFQFFYKKTGVTGPYAFGVGLMTYLCSKEIYVMEHEYYSGLSLAIMCVMAVKKMGPAIAKYLDSEVDKIESDWNAGRADELKARSDTIEAEKLEQWRANGSLMLIDAKKENIALQLEAAFRERSMNVYNEVNLIWKPFEAP